MEFHEKLQELRKSRGLTQEELAEALYVSRTAISKWETGRGYPSIDSLKEISRYFSISIDDLLSGEELISIAEKENRFNIKHMCDMLFGVVDLFFTMLILLPLYPNTVEGHIYSVNLLVYTETALFNRKMYWILFVGLILLGITKIVLVREEKHSNFLTELSMVINILLVVVLAMTREAYAIILVFLLLVVKGLLLLKYTKIGA